ncbi:PREDICTED: granzyme B-like isoform X2 [Myotis brandtii]|uniref:granzyme B-like isoform X2 n=1 Tax=Myotis brandtii TaxID=109478 RepID=UPI0007043F99|nr:PREDICTED: granzyme B-like isoform X2 [Myotis brandtii]
MQPLLLLLAFLLAPKAQAVKIIGGHEVKPHSRPYMAFLRIRISDRKRCGGFLVREDFVLTAAHCWGRSITVILGAHNIRKHERTQRVIPVKTAIHHPNYHPKVNDIMLLQGDSGGPLVCDHMAQGIVAFGKKNGKPPRVETKISSFLPWIKRTMRRFQLQRPD